MPLRFPTRSFRTRPSFRTPRSFRTHGRTALAGGLLAAALLLSPQPTAEAHPSNARILDGAERHDRQVGLGGSLGVEWQLGAKAEKRYDLDDDAFPGWLALRNRTWAMTAEGSGDCAEQTGRDCRLERWESFLDKIGGDSRMDQLKAVNRFVNKVRYRDDRANWKKKDYWAAPGEFFATGGDCEDYAVAKYYSLKRLGFPEERMKIVVLKDRSRGIHHAVLVVDWEGEALMLDSIDNRIAPYNKAKHYQALYSINESAYWLHAG